METPGFLVFTEWKRKITKKIKKRCKNIYKQIRDVKYFNSFSQTKIYLI